MYWVLQHFTALYQSFCLNDPSNFQATKFIFKWGSLLHAIKWNLEKWKKTVISLVYIYVCFASDKLSICLKSKRWNLLIYNFRCDLRLKVELSIVNKEREMKSPKNVIYLKCRLDETMLRENMAFRLIKKNTNEK